MKIFRNLFRRSRRTSETAPPRHLHINPEGASETKRCEHCGNPTRTIWSLVDDSDGAYAVYYASWTPGHVERGAQLYVSIGGWGEGADASKKVAVGIDSRMGMDRPGFEVIDAHELSWSKESKLGRPLTREEAFASGAAEEAFNIIDQALEQDERLRRFYMTEN